MFRFDWELVFLQKRSGLQGCGILFLSTEPSRAFPRSARIHPHMAYSVQPRKCKNQFPFV